MLPSYVQLLNVFNAKCARDNSQAYTQVYNRTENALQATCSESNRLAALCDMAGREI